MNARDTLPAARILHVDDQPETYEWLKLALERKQYEVTVATDGQSALASFTTHRPDIVLLDHELPDQNGLEVLRRLKNADPLVEVVMLTGHGSVSLAVEAMREGAFSFVEKPVEFAVLDAVLDKVLAYRNLHAEAARLRMSAERRDGLGRLVGTSPAMRRLFDLIQLVAPTDASVLIRGENGTGKELVADAVHERSPRANGPIIKINCSAIPASCSSPSCSATSVAPSPARWPTSAASSNRPTAARCCSTKSARCRPTRRSSSCACSRRSRCVASARRACRRPTSG